MICLIAVGAMTAAVSVQVAYAGSRAPGAADISIETHAHHVLGVHYGCTFITSDPVSHRNISIKRVYRSVQRSASGPGAGRPPVFLDSPGTPTRCPGVGITLTDDGSAAFASALRWARAQQQRWGRDRVVVSIVPPGAPVPV